MFPATSVFQTTASQREEHTDHGREREISAIIMKAGRHDKQKMLPDWTGFPHSGRGYETMSRVFHLETSGVALHS